MKTTNCNKLLHYQRGYNLIEVLLSMALGLLIMAALIKLFLWQQARYQELTNSIYLQENSRLAMIILGNEIRMAGYFGCARLNPALIIDKSSSVNLSEDNIFEISPPDKYSNNKITIRKMATTSSTLSKNEMVVIADCQQAIITPYDPAKKLEYADKQISPYIEEHFFIADTQRRTTQNQPIFALYQQLNSFASRASPSVELVDGIQQLQVNPIKSQQNQIIAVIIHLKLQAPHGMTMQTQAIFALREREL